MTVLITTRRLRLYLKWHCIIVKTNYLIRQVSKKPGLARRKVSWSGELSEYDIQYIHRESIKLQVVVDFLAKFTSLVGEEAPHMWMISVNGALNLKGSHIIMVLEGSNNLLMEQYLRFEFKAKTTKLNIKSSSAT